MLFQEDNLFNKTSQIPPFFREVPVGQKYSSTYTSSEEESRKKISRWTISENKLYLDAIRKFQSLLEEKESQRRSEKVFRQIQKHMGIEKTSEQIRGHHNKMKKKYKSIPNMLRLLPRQISKKEKGLK